MFISQAIFLFLIITIVLLTITLAAVVVSYILLLQKMKRIERDRNRIDKRIRDHATVLLHSAHKQALSIVSSAHDKAKLLLQSTKEFTTESKERLASELDQEEKAQEAVVVNANKEFSQMYEQFLHSLEQDTSALFKTAVETLGKSVDSEIGDFKSTLLKETIASQLDAEEKVKTAYREVEKEIQAYKTEKLKSIDDTFYKIISESTKEVLGKSLSMDDHREVIFKGLEQMKRELATDAPK
jgi:hypothetical protein